jgi:hypothetical protein
MALLRSATFSLREQKMGKVSHGRERKRAPVIDTTDLFTGKVLSKVSAGSKEIPARSLRFSRSGKY